jgi:hypothetical protein
MMRTTRASEIGTYLFCGRAWWYASQGLASENQPEMAAGSGFHRRHGRQVLAAWGLRVLAWVILLAALAALAAALTLQIIR